MYACSIHICYIYVCMYTISECEISPTIFYIITHVTSQHANTYTYTQTYVDACVFVCMCLCVISEC